MVKAFVFLLGVVGVYWGNSSLSVPKDNQLLLFAPPEQIKNFSFGYQDSFADSLWIRSIQDITTCEQKLAPEGGPRIGANRQHDCRMGWLYHMLDAIFELAPRWETAARVGPLALSVLVDDIEGATALFNKATQRFPKNWRIQFQAGYHYLYELEDVAAAAKYFEQSMKYGAPGWVTALVAKLYSQSGQDLIARAVLLDYLDKNPEENAFRVRVLDRLRLIEDRLRAASKNSASNPGKTDQNEPPAGGVKSK